MWNENRGQASDLQKLNVEIAMDSGVGFAKFRGVEWRGWATKGNRPQITTCCRMTKKAAHRWAAPFGGWIVPTLTSAAHSYPRSYLRI